MNRKKEYEKENIVAIRKFLKLTQQKFAEKINISRANLAKYETGGAKAPFEIIDCIAIEFGFNVDDIYDKVFNAVTGSFVSVNQEAKKYKTSVEDPDTNFMKAEVAKLPKQQQIIIDNYELQIAFLKSQVADKEKIIALQHDIIENLTKHKNK